MLIHRGALTQAAAWKAPRFRIPVIPALILDRFRISFRPEVELENPRDRRLPTWTDGKKKARPVLCMHASIRIEHRPLSETVLFSR